MVGFRLDGLGPGVDGVVSDVPVEFNRWKWLSESTSFPEEDDADSVDGAITIWGESKLGGPGDG